MHKIFYRNANGKKVYCIHTSGSLYDTYGIDLYNNVSDELYDVDNDISIITALTNTYYDVSPIVQQLQHTNVKLYNTARNITDWNNTLKIPNIIKALKQATTEYALVTDGRDVFICNDLDKSFIDDFKKFNKKIIYNATTVPYPKVVIESIEEIKQINSYCRYLNAGLCFGERLALIKFYEECEQAMSLFQNNTSEQLIIRTCAYNHKDIVGVDYYNELFVLSNKTFIDEFIDNKGHKHVRLIYNKIDDIVRNRDTDWSRIYDSE